MISLIVPTSLLGQESTDSVNTNTKIADSLFHHFSKLDNFEEEWAKVSTRQMFKVEEGAETDSSFVVNTTGKSFSRAASDTLNKEEMLKRILPKQPEYFPKGYINEFNGEVGSSNLDVPKRPISKVIGSDIMEYNIVPVRRKKYSKVKSKIKSYSQVKCKIDTLSRKTLENEVEKLARENINEIGELDKMDQLASETRSKVERVKWDKSKIKSSQSIAKVLSKNVDAVQTGMNKMQDFKKKYSKVNLLNPDGPVLKKIVNKPAKPWQFSLNFNSQMKMGLALQLAPTLGYKLTEKWIGGIGLSYQLQILNPDSSFSISPNQRFSHRIFNQYNFYRNFFLHLEHELPYGPRNQNREEAWYLLKPKKAKGWAGLALQYGIYKRVKGQTQILYNLIRPSGREVGSSRWTIRFNLIL